MYFNVLEDFSWTKMAHTIEITKYTQFEQLYVIYRYLVIDNKKNIFISV